MPATIEIKRRPTNWKKGSFSVASLIVWSPYIVNMISLLTEFIVDNLKVLLIWEKLPN